MDKCLNSMGLGKFEADSMVAETDLFSGTVIGFKGPGRDGFVDRRLVIEDIKAGEEYCYDSDGCVVKG